MKRLILVLTALALFGAGALLFSNYGTGKKSKTKRKTEKKVASEDFVNPNYSPKAIGLLPDYLFQDSKGSFGSSELQGKPYFLYAFSRKCGLECEERIERLKLIETALELEFSTWNDLAFVSISSSEEDFQFATQDFSKSNCIQLKSFEGIPTNLFPADFRVEEEILLIDREKQIRGRFNLSQQNVQAEIIKVVRSVLRDSHKRVAEPREIINPEWLALRRTDQLKKRDRIRSFVDFQFEDVFSETGITWRHQIVDDAGKSYKASHYDHGNGILTADVDGDGLQDLYFISQIGENQVWKNNGNGTFKNITLKSGIALRDVVCISGAFGDVDNDGDQDLFVTTILSGNRLFLNDGKGVFKDISISSGLDYKGHSAGATFFDYDKDGFLDLFVSNVGQFTTGKIIEMEVKHPSHSLQDGNYEFIEGFADAFYGHLFPDRKELSILYHNEGGNRFKNVSAEMNLQDTSWTGDSHPMDLNGDGWTDLYLTNMQGDDQYYENVGGKSFVRRGLEVFGKTPWGSMGIGVSDFDGDQDLDIFISDMHSDMGGDYTYWDEKKKNPVKFSPKFLANSNGTHGNSYFKNEGEMKFEEVSMQNGSENLWPWGMSVGDLNADGLEDVFIASSMNFPFRYGVNSLLINEGGKFADAEFILGVEPRKNNQTATWWFNRKDENPSVYEKWGEQEVWASLGTRSSVFIDVDEDGDLDIVTSEFNSDPMVLKSNLSERNKDLKFVKLDLIGSASNRNGFGAVVVVTTDQGSILRHHHGKSGYMSQSVAPLYVGLGSATKILSVEVRWPSGKVQTIAAGLELNRKLSIREPSLLASASPRNPE